MATYIEGLQSAAMQRLIEAVERERAASIERDEAAAAAREVGVSVNLMSKLTGASRTRIDRWIAAGTASTGSAEPPEGR